MFTGTVCAAESIGFLQRLVDDVKRTDSSPVFRIVAAHAVHRAQAVTDFVADTDDELRLRRLPACSPCSTPTAG